MPFDMEKLRTTVQHNCHIADARHASDYTLCIYLMKMRELYRWENRLPWDASLDSTAVGEWVRKREIFWEGVEQNEFAALPINGKILDPFDDQGINQQLARHNLIYSGGLGRGMAAHFFLADLVEQREYNGYPVFTAGHEYARDLSAPPAMTRDGAIYVRHEALQQIIWEKIQEWRWNQCDSPLGRALLIYDVEHDFDAALSRMTDDQVETVILHELGEIQAGRGREPEWHALLQAVAGGPAEIRLRAIRDNLADVLSTLPALLKEQRPERIHFYFAGFSAMRRFLFPSLHESYRHWVEYKDTEPMHQAVKKGKQHWTALIDEAIHLHAKTEDTCSKPLVALIDKRQL